MTACAANRKPVNNSTVQSSEQPATVKSATVKSATVKSAGTDVVVAPRPIVGGGMQMALPRAVIYKTNIDVDNHVPVVLNDARTGLITYPAVSDVGIWSRPIKLADGWLLDRRGGIGQGTAFLTYTYAQYAALLDTPTPVQLMQSIMPDARVVSARRLPMTAGDAMADTAIVNTMIRNGLPGAEPIPVDMTVDVPAL